MDSAGPGGMVRVLANSGIKVAIFYCPIGGVSLIRLWVPVDFTTLVQVARRVNLNPLKLIN